MSHNSTIHKISNPVMSRRWFVKYGTTLAVTAMTVPFVAACDRKTNADPKLICPNSENLSVDAKELQAAFNYVDSFPDEHLICSECAFFTTAKTGTCGTCTVLGTAQSAGHCDAFSEKTAL